MMHLSPLAVVLGPEPLGGLASVAEPEEVPFAAWVVAVDCRQVVDPAPLIARLRQRVPAATLSAFVDTPRAGRIPELLRAGFVEVAVGEEHLAHQVTRLRAEQVVANTLSRQVDMREGLLLVIDEIAKNPDLQHVLQVAVVRISQLFSIERVSVVIFDHGAKLGFVVMERDQKLLENVVIQIEDYPELQQVIARREPVLIPDVVGDALLAGVRGKLEAAQQHHRGAVLLPLTRRDHVVGALFLRSKALLDEVDADLIAMGRLIANITAVAIGHALEHDELLSETRALQRSKAWADEQLAGLKELREFLDQAKDGMVVTDIEGRITYANATAASILRQEPRTLVGSRFLTLLQPHCHALAERAVAGDAVGDENGYVDLAVGKGDETSGVVVSAAIRPSVNPEGVFISFRDVTGLREIESELRQTKEFLENLIQSSVDAIIATDTDGRVILFNRAAEHMLGYAAQEVVGRSNMSIFYPRGEAWDVLRKLRSEAYGGRGRLQMVRKELTAKGGEQVPVNLTAAIIYEGNREVATVSILSDLRERRRIEEKLSQVQRRLQLTERQAVAVELAGVAAHELNQPLTSIMGYAEMLRRRMPDDEPGRKAVTTICQEADRMASIVRKIGQITAYQTKPYVGTSQILDIGANGGGEPPEEDEG